MDRCIKCGNTLSTGDMGGVCFNCIHRVVIREITRCMKCGSIMENNFCSNCDPNVGDYKIKKIYEYPELKQVNYPMGWECPRCSKINSPTVKQCTCSPVVTQSDSTYKGFL